MLDLNDLANKSEKTQIFYPMGDTIPQVWNKPLGITMVHMICIGGGAGGGAGNSRASLAATNSYSGAGGQPGRLATLLIPAMLIPDTLYCFVGNRSAGGTPGVASGGGTSSFICMSSNVTSWPGLIFLKSENAVAGATPAATTTSGAVGSAATAATLANCMLGIPGMFTQGATVNAAQAGDTGTGGVQSNLSNAILCGGAAGGGNTTSSDTSNAGRDINQTTGFSPSFLNIGGGTGGSGGAGMHGWTTINNSFVSLCGAGGGNSPASGTGGRGGDSGYGCGAGGGGSGVTGGNGGTAGGGLIVITCW